MGRAKLLHYPDRGHKVSQKKQVGTVRVFKRALFSLNVAVHLLASLFVGFEASATGVHA